MELDFTEQQKAWRDDVRTFLTENLPENWLDPTESGASSPDRNEQREVSRRFVKQLGERGWLTLAWPKEYGGKGKSLIDQMIFNEEMGYSRAPVGGTFLAVNNVGPTLILYGSDAQKKEHLPGIASGEVIWCQGMSEPNAGSDLASLQTRAVDDGDDFVINGSKIWTSVAHEATWCYLMARTNPEAPKHRGISVILVPMKAPGVDVRPLVNLADGHEFNEVSFTDVRVPKQNLVGERDRGWYLSTTLLDFERSNIGRSAGAHRTFDELAAFIRQQPDKISTARSTLRNKMADLKIQLEMLRLLSYRVVSMQTKGLPPNYETSICRIIQGDVTQRIGQVGINALGLYGQLRKESAWAPLRGRIEGYYLLTLSNTIGGGTSEIQRQVIATRGLGLPRG